MNKQVRVWGLRTLSRLWLFAGSLSVISLLLIGRCGITETNTVTTGNPDRYASLLEQREEENRVELNRLANEIRNLKLRILQLTSAQEHGAEWNASECSLYVKNQIDKAELLRGAQLNNEYEMIPFSHFTLNRVYPTELGLGKRVVEKPIGYKRKDLSQVLHFSVSLLNRNLTRSKFIVEDFVEGMYRTEPTTGTEYELYFKHKEHAGYSKVTVLRPFAPLIQIANRRISHKKEPIHVILPLSGRLKAFQSFMEKFVKIGLKNDRHVLLTVVYFGEKGLTEARFIMSKFAAKNSASLRLLALNETFSRSKGLKIGIERNWRNENRDTTADELIFFCDVDIVFGAKFLDRCRWNTRPGESVYYPIVFSLYNPHVVYSLQGRTLPTETDQLLISRDTGFWRDFGYGMSCQYKSDLNRVGGLFEVGEDIALYRKFVRSGLKVIRTTDPGIFHLWHPKVCDSSGSLEQYRACVRWRAINEASHAELGALAFPPFHKNLSSPRQTYP